MPKFKDIPEYWRANYRINAPWSMLISMLDGFKNDFGVDLDPDFQRGHVWSTDKSIKYVEYILANGPSAREIQWNSYNWSAMSASTWGTLELVDGKQRMNSALMFLNNEIPAYGNLYRDYTDRLNLCNHYFIFFINNLPTRKDVLQWYLQLNDGGVVHTKEEINKVKDLLKREIKNGKD